MNVNQLQFNNQTWVLVLPLFLMAIDILTGYLTAWQSATVQSGKMRSGLVKKSGEIIEIIDDDKHPLIALTESMQDQESKGDD
jgi:phage-related holin